jgi:DNA-binding CsgD family transcriptional regulator/tetratricopeptide (TPR) repeat protein
MWPTGRPPQWVGRARELAVLRAAVDDLRGGVGSVVWVEGEPGIGKSSLVSEAMAASDPGWDIGWGMADQLTERLPLRVMLECLQVRTGSPDPRRAHAAELLRNRQQSLFSGNDASATGVEALVTLVDELCAAAPTVLVIDDLQWADGASLVVWHQLAASIGQLRLLLVGTCRPTPRKPEVQQVRAAVTRRAGSVITLERLPETDVAALVTAMVGAPPGDTLRRLAAQAGGNPLYVRELIDAFARDQALQVIPVAEVIREGGQLPVSLTEVLIDRLSSVSAETAQMLRAATLLGGSFVPADLAVVLRWPISGLAPALEEAVTAGILAGSGTELVFRHPLIRQALYEGMPLALRTALHAEAARELGAAGADALSVAQQLSVSGQLGKGWALEWLIQAAPTLAARAPQLAVELLQRELDETPSGSQTWDELMTSLLWAQLAAGSDQEAARQAGWALTVMTDLGRRAETYWILAHAQVSAGRGDDAIATVRQALAPADQPGDWRARMLALLSMLERGTPGGFDAAQDLARQALTAAEDASDPFATAHALFDLWLTCSVSRDHAGALGHIDRALRVLGDDSAHADIRLIAFDARTFALQNVDQWPQAELALRDARQFAQRTGSPDRATWTAAAVLRYWLGQWDDALAELGSDTADPSGGMYSFLRDRASALLLHGLTALIAGRREQRTVADEQLRLGLALPIENVTDRENQDFLVAAHALALEQGGATRQAMEKLAMLLPRHGEMTLTHQWLPDLVRLALALGDRPMAQVAADACQAEATAETRPARAHAASLRCRGLLETDPGPLQGAVAHYRTVGPAAQLPAALEDLGVVLAEHGREAEARAALSEAIRLYDGFQARWDIRRAESRLRAYGIRRGLRDRRSPRPAFGWQALTPTEVKIAALVARGDSTSDIALSMFLSRRTVQTYISRILAKLDAKSRVEIVGEALRQGVSP